MAWTWDEFSLMLGRALDDEDSANPAHSDELRLDGLNAALRGLAAHRPRQAVQPYSNVNQFNWPADCYRIAAIVATDEEGYKAVLSAATVGNPGDVLGETGTYWAWNGVIELDTTYPAVMLYYHAYYPTLAGHPAISMPMGLDRLGMPFGLQIVGPRGGDALVLRVAAAIEEAFAHDPVLRRPVPDLAALRAAPPIKAMPGAVGWD